MRFQLSSFVAAVVFAVIPHSARATDPISSGYVSLITHRNGYVMFKVVTANGTNRCAPCPSDPGLFEAGGFCWIADSDRSSFSALLMARTQGLMVSGRVVDIAANCTVYQLTVRD